MHTCLEGLVIQGYRRTQRVVPFPFPTNTAPLTVELWHVERSIAMENTTTFYHTTIGRIHGVSKTPGVDQYLGIQYATLQDRFSRGEMLYSYPDGELDATKLGYVNAL